MIKSLLLDFSWVILHPADRTYTGKLNDLNKQLAGPDPLASYDFDRYFTINTELISKLKAVCAAQSLTIAMFTTDSIQERPEVVAATTNVFDHIFTARELVAQGVSIQDLDATKTDPASFLYIARQLQREPAEVLYIDDKPQNLTAAAEAGMATVPCDKTLPMSEANAKLFAALDKLVSE